MNIIPQQNHGVDFLQSRFDNVIMKTHTHKLDKIDCAHFDSSAWENRYLNFIVFLKMHVVQLQERLLNTNATVIESAVIHALHSSTC